MSDINIPILTYHGVNVDSDQYYRNDHIALAQDLRLVHDLGKRIIPLSTAMDWLLGEADDEEVEQGVVINFDDGSWFDYYDLIHPLWGEQRSMLNILLDFRTATGAAAHATAFVIASPTDRAVLDKTCLIDQGWWTDEWWQPAVDSGVMAIENHSWDHLHPTLRQHQHSGRKFSDIVTEAEADYQILQAKNYIDGLLENNVSRYFVYPCGDYSDYLLQDYLPHQGRSHGIRAALAGGGKSLTRHSSRWLCPRYICGFDWTSPEALESILNS